MLSHGECHDYAIVEVFRMHGFTRIGGGALSSLLIRLQDQGLGEHPWQHDPTGPDRKPLTLSDLGRQVLERSGTA